MNILIVNTNFWGGGASRISRQLYNGLNYHNCCTFFCSGYDTIPLPEDTNITSIYTKKKEKQFLSIYNSFMPECQLVNPYSFFYLLKFVLKNKIDLVHFHNLHGNYIGLLDIWMLSKIRPCLVTMHDMWNITGKCVHANSCTGYQDKCLPCRMNIGTKDSLFSNSSFLLSIKQKLLASKNIGYVSPAKWLFHACQNSILKKNCLYYIPNGVNIKQFQFQDKYLLRVKYKLDIHKKYIVFLSYDNSDRKKGLPFLIDALSYLEKPEDYILITAGKKMRQKAKLKGFQIVEFGYSNEDKKLNEIYGLGDIFVIPTLEDTFPCTILEAMASGTAIVGFKTGGIVEQIDNTTGFLAKEKNAISLKEAIEEAFCDRKNLENMSFNCRKRAVKLYSEKHMLQSYHRLYRVLKNERSINGRHYSIW